MRARAVLAGLILTCLADAEHNRYSQFQVDGSVYFSGGCLRFRDSKGWDDEACDARCSLVDGELGEPGADLRKEKAPDMGEGDGR